MNKSGPVFVSSEASRAVFRWPDAIDAVRRAYAMGQPRTAVPPRSIASDGSAWLRVLPAAPAGSRYFGAKLMGSPGTSTPPRIEYVIVLFDRDSGSIAAFIDGNFVTGARTAATSAAALDRLADSGPLRLGVLGSGFEAAMHVRAFAAVRTFASIAVYSPTAERRESFARQAEAELGVPVTSASEPVHAVEGADVILAAARARGELPILHGEWLGSNAVVVSIGSTIPQQREIDVSVVEWADVIVCDVVDEVLDTTGDMIAADTAGISFRHKAISLGDVLRDAADDQRLGRKRLFKSVGGGLQDVVVAQVVLSNALQAGLATELPIMFDTKD